MMRSSQSRTGIRFRRWGLIALVLMAVIGFCWRFYFRSPSIVFLEYRKSANGFVAVFRITNPSWVPYSFISHVGVDPAPVGVFVRREIDGEEIGRFSGGVTHRTVPPGTSMEIGIIEPPKERFRIGLKFVHGTEPWNPTFRDRLRAFCYRTFGSVKLEALIGPSEISWSSHAPGFSAQTP